MSYISTLDEDLIPGAAYTEPEPNPDPPMKTPEVEPNPAPVHFWHEEASSWHDYLPETETTLGQQKVGALRWLKAQVAANLAEFVLTFTSLITMLVGFGLDQSGRADVATFLYLIAYVTGGAFGVRSGIESLLEKTIDIDLLMVLAALGAAAIGAPFEGAMLLFLFSFSNLLQSVALEHTRNAIQSLMKLRPDTAWIIRSGEPVEVSVDEVEIGDTFLVRPGYRLPLDGKIVSGDTTIDQSSITGESVPAAKGPGDTVFAGIINKNGSLQVEVTKRSSESTLARMVQLVEEAQDEKAHTQRFLERAEQIYALVVIAGTGLAIALPVVFWKEAFDPAFYRAMTLMVAASPCALIISTPATILSAIANGARKGVLFKGGAHVEQAASVDAIVFDKTGTLTLGRPTVTDVRVLEGGSGLSEDQLLSLAASVQQQSEHLLAKATVTAATQRNVHMVESFAFQSETGKGVRATVDEREIHVGNLRYFEGMHASGLEEAASIIDSLQAEGKTPVVVASKDSGNDETTVLGVLAYSDALRPNAASVIRELKSLGIKRTIMLTGDNQRVARAIAEQVGIDDVHADLLPEDKVKAIRQLMDEGYTVAMIGDGVNDAPALATSHVGIAMGTAGTDVALETAEIVLMGDDLEHIPYAIALSRKARRTLIANLSFAMGAIVLMVAAIFSTGLSLPLAVVGHEGGTVLVSLNGLRLLLFKRAAGS